MKAYLIYDFDSNLYHAAEGNDKTAPKSLTAPQEVDIVYLKDFHLFGDTSLEKNTEVKFKFTGEDDLWETNYGWIFVQEGEDSLKLIQEWQKSKLEVEQATQKFAELQRKLPTLNKQDNR